MRVFVVAMAFALTLGLATQAPQAADIGLKGIEGRVGLVSIDEGDAGSTFGISAGADLGELTPDLGLEAGIDFWSKGWDAGNYSWSWTNIAFLGNVRYDFKTESSFHPFAFGGLALCYQSWDWDIEGCTGGGTIYGDLCDFDDSSMEFGIDIGVGAEFGMGDGMTPTVRAGYNSNGGADYLFLQGGVKFPMGE